jgi:hypothetical protein
VTGFSLAFGAGPLGGERRIGMFGGFVRGGAAGHDAGGRQGPPASHRMHGMD